MYMLTEGSWSKYGGIDEPSVGSMFGVNGDGSSRRAIDVTELWYEQSFLDETFRIRLGKMDLALGVGGLDRQPVGHRLGAQIDGRARAAQTDDRAEHILLGYVFAGELHREIPAVIRITFKPMPQLIREIPVEHLLTCMVN